MDKLDKLDKCNQAKDQVSVNGCRFQDKFCNIETFQGIGTPNGHVLFVPEKWKLSTGRGVVPGP